MGIGDPPGGVLACADLRAGHECPDPRQDHLTTVRVPGEYEVHARVGAVLHGVGVVREDDGWRLVVDERRDLCGAQLAFPQVRDADDMERLAIDGELEALAAQDAHA